MPETPGLTRTKSVTITQHLGIDSVSRRLNDKIDVSGYKYGTAQFTLDGGSFGSAVLEVKRSNDGTSWSSMETYQYISANGGMTLTFKVDTFRYLTVEVATASGTVGSNGTVSIHLTPG